MDLVRFKRKPLMGILRGATLAQLTPLVEAIISAGLETIEITMNTPDAPRLIRKAVKLSAGRLMVGAGTVLKMDDLKLALASGATYIVMPVLETEITEYCRRHKIPVFPGALSPQEISVAWQAGATMVKVFPAKFFGPGYFQEIKGPFSDIELLACGGITPQNLRDYFSNGASAIAFGASVFRKDWLKEKDFKSITQAIKKYIEGYSLRMTAE